MTSKFTIILQLTRKRRFVHFWYSITLKLYQKMTFFYLSDRNFFQAFFNEMNLFSTQFWQKKKMIILNRKLIFHLKTENGAYGLNWKKPANSEVIFENWHFLKIQMAVLVKWSKQLEILNGDF